MKKLLPIATLLLCVAPSGYVLAASPKADTSKTKTATGKSADKPAEVTLDSEKAEALAADAALSDYNPDPLLSADRRIKTLIYDEADVYTITTKYGYQTNIVFAPGESIETISVGDRSLWQIIPAANRMFIRPMEDNVITNMTVLTNRHSYQFDLKSLPTGKEGNNIYVARFSYPDMESPQHIVATPQPVMAAPVSPPVTTSTPVIVGTVGPGVTQPVNPNYNYTYSGPDELAPLQVYDDGRSTFVKYRAPHPPFPKPYILDASGKEQQVAYAVQGDMMVIDTIAPGLSLKSPQGTVTVYNEMLNPR